MRLLHEAPEERQLSYTKPSARLQSATVAEFYIFNTTTIFLVQKCKQGILPARAIAARFERGAIARNSTCKEHVINLSPHFSVIKSSILPRVKRSPILPHSCSFYHQNVRRRINIINRHRLIPGSALPPCSFLCYLHDFNLHYSHPGEALWPVSLTCQLLPRLHTRAHFHTHTHKHKRIKAIQRTTSRRGI